MAKTTERLSALKLASLKQPGLFADGGNLYFRIAPSGASGWIFRWANQGRTRDMGLGSFPEINLAAARRLAADCREAVASGLDPIEQRRRKQKAQLVRDATTVTFDEAWREYVADHDAGWRSAKHRAQWNFTLSHYASPIFGKLPVSEIDNGLVMRALKAVWFEKPETAARLRNRIELVLDWARVHGYRSGENPARWKGNLDHLLPARSKVRPVKHHAALPYVEIGAFMTELHYHSEATARALEFTILTAARTGEAVRATWAEIDFNSKVWTIAAGRMKAGREHRVPLSPRAIAILRPLHQARINEFVFAGAKQGRPLSEMALLMLLRRMGRKITVHGFRSTFRDWAAEHTNFENHVVEMALAHAVGDKVEAAYRRGDLFDKRRRLMDAWADYCATTATVTNDVVPMRRRKPNSRP